MFASMASASCLRCLTRPASGLRLAPRITPIITFTAPFSTTPSVSNLPKKKAANVPHKKKPLQVIGRHIRRGKIGQNAKKKREIVRFKKPAEGERKAFRKRIVLSNNNAAPVRGLLQLDGQTMLDKGNVSKVVGLPDKLIDKLRTIEAFKPTQPWGLFRKPHVLVRKESVQLMQRMNEAEAQKQTLRTVLVGDKIAGKSMLLLQAQSHALLNKWVVIHIPEGQDLVNSHTDYSPVPNTSPIQFTQPTYTLKLLQTILKANGEVLKQHKTSKDYSGMIPHFPKEATLADLVAGAKEADTAWPVFQALWNELTTVAGRPPVLLTVDSLAHLMGISAYRDPSFNLVHAHDLTLVRLLADALAGKTPMTNGGAVVAATSRNNQPRSPSMELALDQSEAAAQGLPVPAAQPYGVKYDDRVHEVVRSVDVFRVSGVSKEEARSLMEYWAASGILHSTVNEATVTEKWTLAGKGILGEMERSSLLTTRYTM